MIWMMMMNDEKFYLGVMVFARSAILRVVCVVQLS